MAGPRAAVAGALVLTLACACTLPTVSSTPSPRPIIGEVPSAAEMADWPLALAPATEGGMDALISARLVREGDCLFLDADGERWLPVWQSPGTTWDGSSVTLGAVRLGVGSEVLLGGGESDSAAALDRVAWIKAPPDECQIAKVWWVNGALRE